MIFSSIPVDALSVICQSVGIGVQHKPPYISMTHWEGPDWTYARQTSWQAIQSGETTVLGVVFYSMPRCHVLSWMLPLVGVRREQVSKPISFSYTHFVFVSPYLVFESDIVTK
jgi:hypothetical protein